MFRLVDKLHPTILLDEAQVYIGKDRDEVRALINEGYRKGGRIWRSVYVGEDWTHKSFDCYGPKVLVATQPPWDALRSRSILLRMFKNATRSLAKTLTPEFFERGERLRGQLLSYRFQSLGKKPSDQIEAELNEQIHDNRIREIALPLLSVAPEEARGAILGFLGEMEEEQETEEYTSEEAAYIIAVESAIHYWKNALNNGKLAVSLVRDELYQVLELDDPRYLPSKKKGAGSTRSPRLPSS